MSPAGADGVTIPARLTVRELADSIGLDPGEVSAVLRARSQPAGIDDYLSSDLAIEVATTLGVEVRVEPRDLALEHLYIYETLGVVNERPGGRAGRLVAGVTEAAEELDERIEAASEHWSVARMPVVDRNILRIGLYELETEPELPTAVIVAEAVRLASTYSTERSGSFVNGVLASLAKTVRR